MSQKGEKGPKGSAAVAEISLKQQKTLRKAQRAEAEAERLKFREQMENMSFEETPAPKAKARPKEVMVQDSFGNTVSKAKLDAEKELARHRAEAKVRREAKFKEQEESQLKMKVEVKHDIKTREQEISELLLKQSKGEKLSHRERKLLKQHEETVHGEERERHEQEDGLAKFSLQLQSSRIGDEQSSAKANALDVSIENFSISAPQRLLFNEASLRLCHGRRYGLLGPNGRGKSTLLKYLATRKLPVPETMSMLMVSQEVAASEASVIDQVLSADTVTTALLNEEAALLDQIEAAGRLELDDEQGGHTGASTTAGDGGLVCEGPESTDGWVDGAEGSEGPAYSVYADGVGVDVDGSSEPGVRKTAVVEEIASTAPSGKRQKGSKSSRGKKTSSNSASRRGAEAQPPTPPPEDETPMRDLDLRGIIDRLHWIEAQLDAQGAHSRESRARRILTGLGFTVSMQNGPSTTLSGGWRMRVSLAQALFMTPHLLLLDEPTNHLDLDAVLWLEDYLAAHWTGTALIVSHDADFLDAVCTDILHVDEEKINAYVGNVSSFNSMRNQIEAKKERNWKLQQKTLKGFLADGLTQEKARKRTLEKLELSSLMESPPKEYRVKFDFKPSNDNMPSISVLNVGFSYVQGGGMAGTKMLFENLRFNIGTTSKIALLGANGSGKTTLLGLLAGSLEPTSGEVSHHRNLRIGFYDQHFDHLPLADTPIAFLVGAYGVAELEARKYLGMFGLDGARHLIRIGELSGGQKARVVFASLALKRPHVLILDEPTNHLDLESVEALVEALRVFEGGVVLVSHDARLIKATECEIWVCEGGLEEERMDGLFTPTGLRVERGGFERYRRDIMAAVERRAQRAVDDANRRAVRRREQRTERLARLAQRLPISLSTSLVVSPGTPSSSSASPIPVPPDERSR